MCCSPHGATDRSTRSRSEFVRTSRASPPSTTPPTTRMIRPRVSRRPVSVLGSRRAECASPTRVPLELVRDHVRAARRRGVDPGVAAHHEREERTEQQCGTEQHKHDEQTRLLDARLTLCADVYRVSTPVKPLPWTTRGRTPRTHHVHPLVVTGAVAILGFLVLAACALALGALVTNLVVGHSLGHGDARRRAMVRRPADAHVERSLVGRLVLRRDRDRVRGRGRSRWSSWPGTAVGRSAR